MDKYIVKKSYLVLKFSYITKNVISLRARKQRRNHKTIFKSTNQIHIQQHVQFSIIEHTIIIIIIIIIIITIVIIIITIVIIIIIIINTI